MSRSLPPSSIQDILASAYERRDEIILHFVGNPGIGKTEGIFEFARSIGKKVVQFILSNTVPSEISGIRMPDASARILDVFDDVRMSSLEDGDILFFDEFCQAPPEVWGATLTLMQNRAMASGRKLNDIMIVAASNPLDSPTIMASSVKDRFVWIEVEHNHTEWASWFKDRYGKTPKIDSSGFICDRTTYNQLTPRTWVKLYEWYDAVVGDEAKVNAWTQVVEATHGYGVMRTIIDTYDSVPSPREQLDKVLDLFDIEFPDEFKSWTTRQLVDYLSKLDRWPEIKAKLATVELQEGA